VGDEGDALALGYGHLGLGHPNLLKRLPVVIFPRRRQPPGYFFIRLKYQSEGETVNLTRNRRSPENRGRGQKAASAGSQVESGMMRFTRPASSSVLKATAASCSRRMTSHSSG
jgi:hypothetical protein